MRKKLVLIVLFLFMCSAVFADSEAKQIITNSWHGLSGLYVVPTARVIGKGNLGLGISESKHVEYVPSNTVSMRFMDRQIRQTATYGISDNFEIYVGRCKDQLDFAWAPVLPNGTYFTYGLKYQFIKEDKNGRRPAVSIAVRDLGSEMRDIGPLDGVNNGRKYFLLASKRLENKDNSGKFADFHIGYGMTDRESSAMFGMEMAFSPTISLIAEGMSDSPFINFRQFGSNDTPGRFTYNTGFRLYSDTVPGMVADVGFIGDGAFEFSFGWGYVTKI